MKILSVSTGALALACIPVSASAQTYPLSASPEGWAKPSAPCVYDTVTKMCAPATQANPLPVQPIGRTEAVQLIAASASTGAQMLLGGRYAFAQACLNYNGQAISLRYRGPDGTAMQTAATKSSADTSLVEVPAGAVIDATVPSAAIGCNASMTRIPQ